MGQEPGVRESAPGAKGECGSGSWPVFPASRPQGAPFPSSGCWSPRRPALTAEGVGPPELGLGFRREGPASSFPRCPPGVTQRVSCGFGFSGPTRWPWPCLPLLVHLDPKCTHTTSCFLFFSILANEHDPGPYCNPAECFATPPVSQTCFQRSPGMNLRNL